MGGCEWVAVDSKEHEGRQMKQHFGITLNGEAINMSSGFYAITSASKAVQSITRSLISRLRDEDEVLSTTISLYHLSQVTQRS